MRKLWDCIKRHTTLIEWEHNRRLASQVKDAYERELRKTLYQHAPSPHHPLTDQESFAGTILGRAGGASSRRLRETTQVMGERFDEVPEFTVSRILYGNSQEQHDRDMKAFPRAMACLAVAMEEGGARDRKLGELMSFQYIAAGGCLREMRRRLSMTGKRSGILPRR